MNVREESFIRCLVSRKSEKLEKDPKEATVT